METTLVIIKPNVMSKNQAGAVIQKFQQAGFKISGLKLMKISSSLCEEFYAEHKQKPFFPELATFMTSIPVIVLALSGNGGVAAVRALMGHTDPKKAQPGTIRYEYGDSVGENAVHGSDSLNSAQRELKLFFSEKELFN
ncbi:MAG: nucleoside-diphosphate kinase [Bdellovibrionales bacterium]|nr:nucleoside-diphosphate kinase [Bdellovibrionales bacterium]